MSAGRLRAAVFSVAITVAAWLVNVMPAQASALTRRLQEIVIGRTEDAIVARFGQPGSVRQKDQGRVLSWRWRVNYVATDRARAGNQRYTGRGWRQGNCGIEVTFDVGRIARAVDYSGSRQACHAVVGL